VSGNTQSLSYSFDTRQNFDILKNRIGLAGRFIYSRSDGVKSAEVYYAHVKYDRQIGTRACPLGDTSYVQNRLAGCNFSVALSLGGGLTWVKHERTSVLTELAFGWNNVESTRKAALDNVSNDNLLRKTISSSFPSSILNNRLTSRVTQYSEIVLRITAFFNMDQVQSYRLNFYASLSAAISPQLSLKTSVELIYDNDPVPGVKHIDTCLLSSLAIKISDIPCRSRPEPRSPASIWMNMRGNAIIGGLLCPKLCF
jgi:hypothetical protein